MVDENTEKKVVIFNKRGTLIKYDTYPTKHLS